MNHERGTVGIEQAVGTTRFERHAVAGRSVVPDLFESGLVKMSALITFLAALSGGCNRPRRALLRCSQ